MAQILDSDIMTRENAKGDLSQSSLLRIVNDPNVIAKMQAYLRLHNVEPASTPLLMAGQVEQIKRLYRKQYRRDTRKKFTDQESFDAYSKTDGYLVDQEGHVIESEKQRGFYGFDDTETEHLLPLMALGMAKKFISSPLGHKITGAIGKLGGKVLAKITGAKNQQQQADTAQSNADLEQQKANALRAGVPADQVNAVTRLAGLSAGELLQISQKVNDSNDERLSDMVRQLKTQLSEHKNMTGETSKTDALTIAQQIIDGHKKSSSKALDALSDAVTNFKSSQTNQAIGKKMPLIIGGIIVAILIGVLFARMAKA